MKWLNGQALREIWQAVRERLLTREQIRQAFTRNIALKLLSLAIAFGLWAFVNFGERDAEETLKVPLELRSVPASLMITSPRVDFVDVRVVGPRTLLGRIDRNGLAIGLDLEGVRPGPAVFRVGGEELNLPRGVNLVRVNPSQVTLELEKVGSKTVPVQIKLVGKLASEFQLIDSKVAPETVQVSGPASNVEDVHAAFTEAVDLSKVGAGIIEKELPLEPVGDYLSFSAMRVAAQIRIEELSSTREFKRVPVQLRGASKEQRVVPETVRLVVRGPRRIIADLELAPGTVSVEVAGDGGEEDSVPLTIDLPERVDLMSVEPSQVKIAVSKRSGRPRR